MLKRFITGSTLSLIIFSSLTQTVHASEIGVNIHRDSGVLSLETGINTPGIFLNSNFAYNPANITTGMLDIGVGYNLDIDSLRISPSVKTVMGLHTQSSNKYLIFLGLGGKASYALSSHWSIYGQCHYALQVFKAKTINPYYEMDGGIKYSPNSTVSLDIGYRHVVLNNEIPSNVYVPTEYLAHNPYLGISISF
ncbi:hypothetical protein CRV12_01655 [Candidatus Pantoea edessiphila]|uniref:Outer membrane protein beta-barrel domain-containing protein n=1 Tax=Candidatus Pantoea edessiphila TaxID=2044610 RepID=A0A2P5SZY5_9GAMM|nr:YfaZ family outer membrane protein [Candidatus Pantoea edessiphila]PPI87904.1 hypothetical protein CRV12_01655 [Candidatus Pantoea edessiphila]